MLAWQGMSSSLTRFSDVPQLIGLILDQENILEFPKYLENILRFGLFFIE